MEPRTKMRLGQVIYVSSLTLTLALLSGCQKARMSTVPARTQTAGPGVTPYTPPRQPPFIPPRPGGVIPLPTTPVNRPPIITGQPPVVNQVPPTVMTIPPTVTTPHPSVTPAVTEPIIVSVGDTPRAPVAQQPIATAAQATLPTPTAVVAEGRPVVPHVTSISVAAAPQQGESPAFKGSARVVVPNNGNVLATCSGPCAPRTEVFQTPSCGTPERPCQVTTELVAPAPRPTAPVAAPAVAPATPVMTCPEIELRTRPMTNKLDILFVVDTSASMKEERAEIARQMTNFIAELSPDVEYRIGIMLGHGPRTTAKSVEVGSLFSGNANPNLGDTVIFTEIYGSIARNASVSADIAKAYPEKSGPEYEKAIRARIAEKVAAKLEEKMRNVPNDTSEVEGEAGLLNLYTAMTDIRKRADLVKSGLHRPDAALAVIFVADENDVCYDYAAESKRLDREIKPNFASEALYRKTELVAFNAGDVCRSTADGQRLTPEHVYNALKSAMGSMPLILSGILYLDEQLPPKTDKWSKDNEKGRGYLDVIAMGRGQAADLAKKDFGKALAKIGDFSNFRMKFDHVFPMQNVKDVRDIDPQSVRISITDSEGTEKEFNSANVKLELDETRNTAKVAIAYEVMQKVYADGLVKPGSKVVIRYSTKSAAAN